MTLIIEKPILFFCIKNPFCERFYLNYVQSLKEDVQVVDLGLGLEKNKELQLYYSVDCVPTLILLKSDMVTSQFRWSGGKPPDLKKIQMELVMRSNYG